MKKTSKRLLYTLIYLITMILIGNQAAASTYSLPSPNEALIGSVQYNSTQNNDNIVSVAQHYDVGYNQIIDANPQIDPLRAFSSGILLKLPTAFILPPIPRKGIVINLSEMRLYYFPKDSNIVMTYPIGIGKVGKTIPLTNTYVSRKIRNPTWIPTPDIRAYNREQGIVLPANIPPGPDNPLGPYAIYLGIPEYRIHSTIYPESIGRRASFGCIRMNESDIKDFFPLVQPKTPVSVVDIPTKIGWQDNKLFLEAHPPLEERKDASSSYGGMVELIEQQTHNQPTIIDWQLVNYISTEHDGVPHEIGMKVSP